MKANLFDLTGSVALITGSSRGLGLALAGGLARAGAAVVLNGRDEARLDRAVAGLRGEGLAARGAAFDVTSASGVAAGVERVEREAGPIHILVNNAGIQCRQPLEEMTEQAWREVLDTNLTSAFLVSQAVGRRMIPRRAGKIINICSLMSELHRPTIANYSAAKGGLKMLTRALAVEWGRHNIQANGIGPGYFITEMTQPLVDDPKFSAWICGRTPLGRWGRPEDLIGAAVFLASPASDYVTGQIIYVDGGILATL